MAPDSINKGPTRKRPIFSWWRLLWAFLALVVFIQCAGMQGWNYKREIPLATGARVVDHRRKVWGLILGIEGAYVPIPHHWDGSVGRELVLGSRSIPYGAYAEFHASPDGTTVLAENGLGSMPWELWDVASGARTEVPAPEMPEQFDLTYPFQFVRWKKDSQAIIAAVMGTCSALGPGYTMMTYRELWEIDAHSGASHRVHRTTQVYSEQNPRPDPSTDPPL